MRGNDDAKKAVAKLRAKIGALVKRSSEKFEEMKQIQERIDRLSEQILSGRNAPAKDRKRDSH